VMVLVAQLM